MFPPSGFSLIPLGTNFPGQVTGNNLHPTQKPVSVLTPLVESFSNPGDVVLDPFCGSGSTLLAAHNLNRRFLGIELSKQYFDLAEQRLR